MIWCTIGINIIYGTDDPFDDSSNGHGTHVAGIIAGLENDLGVIGVAPEALIYAVKVLDWTGFGSVSTVIEGIQWAMDNGMDIINSHSADCLDYHCLVIEEKEIIYEIKPRAM